MPRWHFYAQDGDRSWDHNNHAFSLGHIVTGDGRTLAAAIEDARRKADECYGDPGLIDNAVAIPADLHFHVNADDLCRHCGGHHPRSPEDLCIAARREHDRDGQLVAALLGPDLPQAG